MNATEFIAKWSKVELTERSAAQQHFLDLCELLGHEKPAAADPTGESFTFEKGAAKHGGGDGWADVWKREHFAWEYKGKKKDLAAAYDQLLKYRADLQNPPLLVVCDMDRIIVRTNFTNTRTVIHEILLAELGEPRNLEILRSVFHAPNRLHPTVTSEAITREAARHVGEIAQTMRARGLEPHQVARFLDRIVFCLFAEDVRLLPENVFTKVTDAARGKPELFAQMTAQLFGAMAHGGSFGADLIRHFNGNLFTDQSVLNLTPAEIEAVREAARLDWSAVDPSIFGTLFERGLDPEKRSQLGAHYTSRQDIETLVEPVVMQPLRREWEQAKARVGEVLARAGPRPQGVNRARTEADRLLHEFLQRLAAVRVLDPACGSGNFLYITLQKLKDLEKEVIDHAYSRHFSGFLPEVHPSQLYGIEVNPYAFDLAQMTVWIGYLQWHHNNGYPVSEVPILRPMEGNFRCMDAILDLSDPEHPREPGWPEVEFIVGNPPFLGNKLMRAALGADYCAELWRLYEGRIPPMSDLCCYWFEKARAAVSDGRCLQAGLLATTGIKQVGARRVLERVCETGRILFAVSDRPWILEGAAVRISMVGFGRRGTGVCAELDGQPVSDINSDLTSGSDLTRKAVLQANKRLCFMGTTKVGAFDIDDATARDFLAAVNVHGRPNSDVVRPYRNGSDLVQSCSNRWIIDFGVSTTMSDAALYEAPFEHLIRHVKPERERNARRSRAEHWWLLGETLPAFRRAVASHTRYAATPRVSKYRLFVWLDTSVLPDSKVIAVALSDDIDFGVLHSGIHQAWTLATSGLHGGERPTYNPTLSFETFPFPRPTPNQRTSIAVAARELTSRRNQWLNPPEWTCEKALEFPGSADGPWARYVHDPDERGIGMVRYPRLVPRDAECARKLAERTLTNLYNQRPTWLDLAHRRLDEAVFAAYGWDPGISDEEILARLLALNLERAEAECRRAQVSEDASGVQAAAAREGRRATPG